MKINIKKIFFFAGMIFFVSAVIYGKTMLTWESCITQTAEHNPDLKSSYQAVQSAEAQYRGSYSGFMPDISADAGYRHSDSDSSASAADNYSLGLSVRQSLFSGCKDAAGVRRAKAGLDMALSDHDQVKAQISYDLKEAFAQLLYAQEQQIVSQTIAERLKENVRLVELKYTMGVENKGAYLKSQADYAQALFEVNQTKRSLAAKQKKLAGIMGVDYYTVTAVTGSFTLQQQQPESPDYRQLLDLTPVYRKAIAQVESRRAAKTSAAGDLYPALSASGSFSRQGDAWTPDTKGWSVGASVSVPLFSGGTRIAALRSADAQYNAARADLDAVSFTMLAALENAYNALQDAAEQVTVKNAYRAASQVRAEIAQSQYTKGLISFEDWDKIENELINSERAIIGSLRDALIAEANWEKIIGKGVLP